MDSERVNAIRARHTEGYKPQKFGVYHIDVSQQMDDDIAYLLQELDRANFIVSTAKGIVMDADHPQLARNWATDRLREALLEIANKGAYEMNHVIGGEHGHGVSTGLVKAGKYAAMVLRNMGMIETHPVLDADVTVNPIGRAR